MLIKRSDGSTRILTGREVKMLQMIADGSTGRQIAIELNIGYQSTKNLKMVLYAKLEAVSAPHAVAIGFRKGIIE